MLKKFLALLTVLLLCMGLAVPALAAGAAEFVQDDARLLSAEEENKLQARLQQLSETYSVQLCVYTAPEAMFGNVDTLAENIYDGKGLGYGASRDGILLLVCMEPREFRILSNGAAAYTITMDVIDEITGSITARLSAGEYARAFEIFADRCEYYLEGQPSGDSFAVGRYLAIAFAVGVIVGLIVAFVLRGQLKSVRRQERADVYVRPGSMEITRARDIFLYQTLTRTPRPQNSGSSRSGGGGSRNMGGGRF